MDKQNLLTSELDKLSKDHKITLEKKVAADGSENLIWLENGKEVAENQIADKLSAFTDINQKLLAAQNALVQVQMTIAKQTDVFQQEEAVKQYNNFVKENKLDFETLTPENVIDQRISYFTKKGSAKDVEIWQRKKKEYQVLQDAYNAKLHEYNTIAHAAPATQQENIPHQAHTETFAVTVDKTPNTIPESTPDNKGNAPIEEPAPKDITQEKEITEMSEQDLQKLTLEIEQEASALEADIQALDEPQSPLDTPKDITLTKSLIKYLTDIYHYVLGKNIHHLQH